MTNRLRGRGQGPVGPNAGEALEQTLAARDEAVEAAAAAAEDAAEVADDAAAVTSAAGLVVDKAAEVNSNTLVVEALADQVADDAAYADLAANAAAASVNDGLYANVAAAEAAAASSPPGLAEGAFFFTVDPPGQLYRIVSGSAVEQDFVLASATAQAVADLQSLIAPTLGDGVYITDSYGNTLFTLDVEMVLRIFNALSLSEASETAGLVVSEVLGDGLFVTDSDDNLFFSATSDGISDPTTDDHEDRIEALESATASSITPRNPLWDDIQINAQRVGVPAHGQSHTRGNLGSPVVHGSASMAWAEKFNGGVRPDDLSGNSTGVDTGDFASIEALFEQTKGVLGETPVAGMLDMVGQLLLEKDGIDPAEAGQTFLGSSPGLGGTTAAELANGTVPFARLKQTTTSGFSISDGEGKSFVVGALVYDQGNSNYASPYTEATAGATWTSDVEGIVADFQAHNASVIGIDRRLPVILTQTSVHPYFSRTIPTIALAQLALANDPESLYCLATPLYPFEYDDDGIHMTASGYCHLGAYWGYALWSWLIRGNKPMPFIPTVQRSGKSILLQFPVEPGKKLELVDWAGLADYGVSLHDPSDTSYSSPITITDIGLLRNGLTGVAVINTDTTLDAGTLVNLGWNASASVGDGKRGLIGFRDNTGDTLRYGLLGLPLHRWPPINQIISA